MPPNIEVMRISPKAVRLKLGAAGKKREVKMTPETAGAPAMGFRLKGIEVSPETVTVEGAESAVNRLSLIKTEVINLSGMNKRETFLDVNLNLYGRDIKF